MALIRCPKCNIQTSDEREKCPMCGTPLKAMPKPEPSPEETQTQEKQAPKKKKKLTRDQRNSLIVGGVFVGLILAGVLALQGFKFVRLLQANSYINDYQFAAARARVSDLDAGMQDKVNQAILEKAKDTLYSGVWGYAPDQSQYMYMAFHDDGIVTMLVESNGVSSYGYTEYVLNSSTLTLRTSDNAGVYQYYMSEKALILMIDEEVALTFSLQEDYTVDENGFPAPKE